MRLYDVYPKIDINIVKGRSTILWDDQGQDYLDMYGGDAAVSIGHNHPHYITCVSRQLAQLGFCANGIINGLQEELALRLGEISGYTDYQLFLLNSGYEATQAALQLATYHNKRKKILIAQGSTYDSQNTHCYDEETKQNKMSSFHDHEVMLLPLNDIEAWTKTLHQGDVCAVLLECVDAQSGCRSITYEFAQAIASAARQNDTILICDETLCGYGRTGKFFAHQWLDLVPDLITVSKGMANGFPMGGVIISPTFEAVKGQMSSTFGGNHLACTAALSVLDVYEQDNIVKNALDVGSYFRTQLETYRQHHPHIVKVRGKGLLLGLELDIPHEEVWTKLLHELHVLTGTARDNIILIMPPLCMTKPEVDDFIYRLNKVLESI